MATKTNYKLIQDEWIALRDFLRSVEGDMEAKGMSAYLLEHGHIAPKAKGAKPGQDYLRYINKKSKVNDALQGGDSWEAFLDCQIKETEAKIEAQERTGKAKVLLKRNNAERLQPREVREPVEEEAGEKQGSVTQALRDALQALMESQTPENREAGQRALDRYAEQAEKRAEKRKAKAPAPAPEAPAPAPEAPAPAPEAPAPAPEAPKPARKFGQWLPCAGDGTKPCPKKAPVNRNTILRNIKDEHCCPACAPPEEEEQEEEQEQEEELDE
jgi:hypothetical protein